MRSVVTACCQICQKSRLLKSEVNFAFFQNASDHFFRKINKPINVNLKMESVASCSKSESFTNEKEKPKSKLGLCEVCAKRDAKYCCPRCEVKTCSLGCNKIHKFEVECNGQRDRTKFIPVNKFTNLDLSSDYRLLEEISRVVEASKKGRRGHRFYIDKKSLKLQQEAMRRKVTLKFLPRTFVRHKNNTTRFNSLKKIVEWHVDWIFVNSDNFKISEDKVPDNVKLTSILHKYLVKQENPDLQEKLQFYQAVDLPGIKVLLKAEMQRGKKFYELDPTCTLKECLKDKIIIEYPTIHLVLKEQADFYDIIDSDDDEDNKEEIKRQLKSGQEIVNKIIKKSESDESVYESLKNLLFISEYSDEEIKSEED